MQYALLERLPSSASSEVFRAEMENAAGVRRPILFKRLARSLVNNARALAAFEVEREALSRLSHPNIVCLLASGSIDDVPFIATEWMDGIALDTAIECAQQVLPLSAVMSVLQAMTEALAHAHTGMPAIIHRDVKPGNVLVDRAGQVKLTDFGCAKSPTEIQEGRSRTTNTGTLRGTLSYLPPERVLERPFGPQADVYSAGVVLYEMLTGFNPFCDESDYATLERILALAIPPPSAAFASLGRPAPDAVVAFDEVVMRAIDRDPEARYPSIRAFGEHALHAAVQVGVVSSRRELKRIVAGLVVPRSSSPPLEILLAN